MGEAFIDVSNIEGNYSFILPEKGFVKLIRYNKYYPLLILIVLVRFYIIQVAAIAVEEDSRCILYAFFV